jgi:hypothetical protein
MDLVTGNQTRIACLENLPSMTSSVKSFSAKKSSQKPPHSQSWQLRWPFGRTFALSILFFCLFYIAGELVARTKTFQAYFISQTWNSPHRDFERQLARLDRVFTQEKHIDCIFLGNSMVWRGFDPAAFQKGYRNQTGEDLHCFNFGVDGMPASIAGALAKVLVEDYHPLLLIYGIDARDLAVPIDSEDAKVLAEMPWLRYRMGEFSPEGWFIDKSRLYRYRLALQHWLRFDYQFTVHNDPDTDPNHRYGFDSDSKVGDITRPPDPNSSQASIQYYFKTLWHYKILQENVDGFIQVLNQEGNVPGALVVELPVPETYKRFFKNREKDYQRFVDQIEILTTKSRVPFWLVNSWVRIPSDGWVDYAHMNEKGASIFSQAFGERLGKAIQLGLIQDPVQIISSK